MKADPIQSGPLNFGAPVANLYFGLLPVDAAGGHGVPGATEFPCPEFPWPEFPWPESEWEELDEPLFALLGAPAVPGNDPHGDPLGVVPGAVEVFGLTVGG